MISARSCSRDFAIVTMIGFADYSDVPSFCWWIQLLDCICSVCKLTRYLLSDFFDSMDTSACMLLRQFLSSLNCIIKNGEATSSSA
jgi:hypothetical protein